MAPEVVIASPNLWKDMRFWFGLYTLGYINRETMLNTVKWMIKERHNANSV